MGYNLCIMLKYLAILGLLVLVGGAWSQVPGDGSQQHNNTQKKANPAQVTQQVALAIQAQGGAHKQEQSPQEPSAYPWKELLAPANMPNWALVLVGGITGWFVYKTLKSIKKQADIMEKQAKEAQASGAEATKIALVTAQAAQKSADAALLNAESLIVSERPLLLVSIESFGVSLKDETPLATIYRVIARNHGRTPAELIEGHCSCKLQSAYGFVPSDDMFDPFYAPNENLAVAGAEFLIRELVPDAIASEKDMEGMEPKMLYIDGKLVYWDTFKDRNDPQNEPYVTRWSFTYDMYRKRFHRTAGPWPKNT
jgi:hypothetical protein